MAAILLAPGFAWNSARSIFHPLVYSLLVAAMHLLLSDVVTEAMLHKSEQYLNRFYGMFATLYGM